jgi:hypothetical protein
MSALLELALELVLNVIGYFLEAWFGDLSWRDTKAGLIFVGVIIVIFGGVIWWELR